MSTYSTDLRIELIATGDQAGTWGSTTNKNYQYILEQAIAGVQSIALSSSPYSLTYLNGATSTLANNQAVAAALIFTGGVSGGTCTVNTPSSSQKIYIIFNNTTSINTVITMQVTGSGGSTVTIPYGVTMTVYTDGTNFYAANTGTSGGTVTNAGNVSFTGAYPRTIAATASTNVTLPVSGTLVSSVTALPGAVTGTPSSSTFIRGDGVWASGISGPTGPTGPTGRVSSPPPRAQTGRPYSTQTTTYV